MLEPFLISTICDSFLLFFIIPDNIFHLNVDYARKTMFVQHFELQGRCFTNFHYYYLFFFLLPSDLLSPQNDIKALKTHLFPSEH